MKYFVLKLAISGMGGIIIIYTITKLRKFLSLKKAGRRSAVGSASDTAIRKMSRVRHSIRPHTFVSPSVDSRRAVVSYWLWLVLLGVTAL